MSHGEDYIEYEYITDSDTIIGVIIKDTIEIGEVAVLDQYLARIMDKHCGFSNLVLDVRNLKELTCPLVGIFMMVMKRKSIHNGCIALVMDDDFLKKHMFRYPDLFDYYTIFRTIEEAIRFIAR